jgi:hypothetical protein
MLSGVLLLWASTTNSSQAAEKTKAEQLVITRVFLVLNTEDIFIEGRNFDKGDAPVVTFEDLETLVVSSFTANMIEAKLPVNLDPGDYLLTVTTGKDKEQFDTYDLTIGAVGPQGPPGPEGAQGPPGPSTTDANTLFIGSDQDGDEPFSTLQLGTDGVPTITVMEGGNGGNIESHANIQMQNPPGGFIQLRFNHPGGTKAMSLFFDGDNGVVQTDPGSPNALIFRTNGMDAMKIDSNRNVGIGTMNPQSMLEVSGGDIRVTGGSFIDDGTTLNAPDYVFEQDYLLMSLDELREYIAREKHLPNIPSAEDIKKEGLNISEFQMKLLEKVEELTLYILAQQRQIDIQQTKIQALEVIVSKDQ